MANKIYNIVGTALLFAGFMLAFLPHALHSKIGLDDGTTHLRHVVSGIAFVIVALAILVWNNNALKVWKK